MAASDLVSSPARPTLHDRLMMLSSSPDLPDLKDLIAKKPKTSALRSGSAAAPIPAESPTTFTTAAALLRSAQASNDETLDTIDEPERPPAKKAPAKRAPRSTKAPKRSAKEVVVLSSDGPTPEDDNGTTTESGKAADKDSERSDLEEKPWKKFKASTDLADTEGETSAQAAEHVNLPAKARTLRKRAGNSETVSKHFAQKSTAKAKTAKGKAVKESTPEPPNLQPAVQRRTDWTPPRADTTPLETDPFGLSVEFSQVGEGDRATDSSKIFQNLQDMYGHKAEGVDSASMAQETAKVLGKRKVIEMLPAAHSPKMADEGRDPSPVKEKAPKKKPRTITELATAAYISRAAEVEEDHRNEDSILEYLTVNKDEQGASKSKPKAKGKAAKVTKPTKRKVPGKQAILLSPEAAIRQSAGQDFVFGTSSQLAREQSPSFLKDLHAALRVSNIAKEDEASTSGSGRSADKEPKKSGRNLWSVSARDEDGELVNMEIIDLVGSPALPDDGAMAILDPWKDLRLEPAESETADSSLVEIGSRPAPANAGETSQSPTSKSQFFLSQPKITVNSATATSSESHSRPSVPLITGVLEEEAPPPSNQQQSQEEVRTISTTRPKPVQKPRPKYELFTDAKLAKEISSYGFKAVKTRSAMIALLDQCWKSKSQAPSAGLLFSTSSAAASPKGKTASAKVSAASTSPAPKRPRGRSKKANSTVEDSALATVKKDGPASPAKKRGRPRKEAATASKTTGSPTPQPPPKSPQTASTPKRKKAAPQKTSAVSESEIDSAADLTSPEKLFSSPLAVDVSVSEDTEMSLTLSPTTQQSALFDHITKAVTSAPRTTDPENPSWHEKILMYDPIILEDLTAWLNSGQLTRVGHDGEVAPADVKKWCESKSVCCLWRVSYRGKERKRL